MYTWEIKNYFEKRNYQLTEMDTFYRILRQSPQIKKVQLLIFNEDFHKYSLQTDDGFSCEFYLKR